VGITDLGLSHIAFPVSDLEASIAFYRRFADMDVVHRRIGSDGGGVAWLSDLTRPFVLVLLETEVTHRIGGWAHLGVGVASRDEVDHRLVEAAAAGHDIVGPCDDTPPVGYWGIISDPDGHQLEVAYGQEVRVMLEALQPPMAGPATRS